MSEITKADLIDLKNDLKDHIDLKMGPVVTEVNGMKVSLYGREGRNGLVRDVNDIKNSGKWLKAIAGTGFIGGVSKWLHEFFR